MATYVDQPKYNVGRMVMCHLLADTEAELHAMADAIGLRKRWLQREPVPHFDICKAKRALAIQHGAREVTLHQLGQIVRRLKGQMK